MEIIRRRLRIAGVDQHFAARAFVGAGAAGYIAFLLLLPCDSFYGVESRATLHGTVNVSCVDAALHTLPEAGRILYQRHQSHSTEILPKRRDVQITTHDWLYGEGQSYNLEIIQTPDGWEYTNSRRSMGAPVPHEEMARFLPVMQMVNRALQNSRDVA